MLIHLRPQHTESELTANTIQLSGLLVENRYPSLFDSQYHINDLARSSLLTKSMCIHICTFHWGLGGSGYHARVPWSKKVWELMI